MSENAARLEGKIALERFLKKFPNYRLVTLGQQNERSRLMSCGLPNPLIGPMNRSGVS